MPSRGQIMTEKPADPQQAPDPSRDDEALYAELVGQTAKIEWGELERFFAKGQVVRVDAGVDLVDVAMALVRDRTGPVRDWQAAGRIDVLENDTARRWAAGGVTLWAVVTPPWVLVQEAEGAPSSH
jgi:hypothetical protein